MDYHRFVFLLFLVSRRSSDVCPRCYILECSSLRSRMVQLPNHRILNRACTRPNPSSTHDVKSRTPFNTSRYVCERKE